MSARNELPCAGDQHFPADLIAGAIDSAHIGSTRATVSFRHSASGSCSRGTFV